MFRVNLLLTVILSVIIFIFVSCDSPTNNSGLYNPILTNPEFNYHSEYNSHLIASVDVNDENGLDNIDSVWGWYRYLGDEATHVEFALADSGDSFDLWPGDGTFTGVVVQQGDSITLGWYQLGFEAIDHDGRVANTIDTLFWAINGSNPIIFNLIAPDSLEQGSVDTSFIYIDAYDPDGLSDIDSVYFSVTRPDGTSNGLHFYLNDDGEYGDLVEGDAIYTVGILAPSPTAQTGDYIFRFQSFDLDDNFSNIMEKIVTAY